MPQAAPRACSVCGQAGCTTHTKKHNWDSKRNKAVTDPLYNSKQWRQTRQAVMKRDNFICQSCLKSNRYTQATAVDHIVPVAVRGTEGFFDAGNLQALCTACHRAKTAADRVHQKK